MVTVETSLTRITESLQKKLSLKELEEILEQLGLEIDDIEGDDLKIDVTAERPDLVSTQGIIRALKAFLEEKLPEYYAQSSDYEVHITKEVEQVRPHTCCVVVKNLSLTQERLDEIIWVQEKIHATFGRHRKKAAIGIYPLEQITFPITYTADEPKNIRFRPLDHPSEISADKLDITPTGKQYLPLLKGAKKYPYFKDANNKVLSLPPIINSYDTGRVTENTKEVFVECSGHDYKALTLTLNIIAYLFQDLGGELYQVTTKYPDKEIITPDLSTITKEITTNYVKTITGLELSSQEIARLLKKMMHLVVETKKDSVIVRVPAIRADMWHEIDLVDDILRAYGINNVEAKLPMARTQANTLEETKRTARLSELLIGQGYLEAFTFMLSSTKQQYENMLLKEQEHMKLGFSAEASLNMVRTWILPELLYALKNNRNATLPVKLFEVGEVVVPKEDEDVLSQTQWHLSLAQCDTSADLTTIRQSVEQILEVLGITYSIQTKKHDSFIEGRCAAIIINDKEAAVLGEIRPEVLVKWGIKHPVAAAEIKIQKEF